MSRTLLVVYASAEAKLSSAEKTKKIKTIKKKKTKTKATAYTEQLRAVH